MSKSAGICVVNDGGKVLLLKRSDGLGWCIPGGSIDPGEDAKAAATRETFEEAGLRVDVKEFIGQFGDEFDAFYAQVATDSTTVLNDEHTEAQWFAVDDLPPDLAFETRVIVEAMTVGVFDGSDRVYDTNGWFEIQGNPLSLVGVFPYKGKNIPAEVAKGNLDGMVSVYRPAEELASPETAKSFRLVPWIIDHTLLGDGQTGMTVDQKIARGVTGEQIYFDASDPAFPDGALKGNIKCFSEVLAQYLANGRTPLSLGYRCRYEYAPGVFKGLPYTYIQRQIRGNHLATVNSGRMGPEVAVMDSSPEDISMTVVAKPAKAVVKPGVLAVVRKALLSYAADAADDAAKEPEGGEIKTAIAAIEAVAPLLEAIQGMAPVDAAVAADLKPEGAGDTTVVGEPAPVDTVAKDDAPMDKAAIMAMIKQCLAEAKSGDAQPVGMDANEMFREISTRDTLAKRVSDFVGTFDHREMTTSQVAVYGIEKLGLKAVPKGAEQAVLSAYLQDRKPERSKVTFTGDGKDGAPAAGWLKDQLNKDVSK